LCMNYEDWLLKALCRNRHISCLHGSSEQSKGLNAVYQIIATTASMTRNAR
jgi:hypothetical protein